MWTGEVGDRLVICHPRTSCQAADVRTRATRPGRNCCCDDGDSTCTYCVLSEAAWACLKLACKTPVRLCCNRPAVRCYSAGCLLLCSLSADTECAEGLSVQRGRACLGDPRASDREKPSCACCSEGGGRSGAEAVWAQFLGLWLHGSTGEERLNDADAVVRAAAVSAVSSLA